MKRAVAAALLCACRGAPVAPAPATANPHPSADAPVPPPTLASSPAPKPAPFAWRHAFVTDPDAGAFAVVLGGTRVHKRPGDPGVLVDEWHPRVVKVLGRAGEHLEVALDWADDPSVRHCLLAPFAEVGLRVFIPEDALADVVTATQHLETGDDAGVVVAPGVLVHRDDAGARPLWTLAARHRGLSRNLTTAHDHLTLTTRRGPAAIGKTYAPVRALSLRPELRAPAPFSIALGAHELAQLDYGESDIRLIGPIYGQSEADPDRVVFGSECLQIAGRVNRALTSRGSGGAGCGVGPFSWEERWRIPAGTLLTWRTGGPAGELHRDLTLGNAPERRGRSACFAPPLGCGHYPDLAVCVPSAAVVHLPATERPWLAPQ